MWDEDVELWVSWLFIFVKEITSVRAEKRPNGLTCNFPGIYNEMRVKLEMLAIRELLFPWKLGSTVQFLLNFQYELLSSRVTNRKIVKKVDMQKCQSKMSKCLKVKCPSEFDPVCGTDATVYTNPCLLKVATCLWVYSSLMFARPHFTSVEPRNRVEP